MGLARSNGCSLGSIYVILILPQAINFEAPYLSDFHPFIVVGHIIGTQRLCSIIELINRRNIIGKRGLNGIIELFASKVKLVHPLNRYLITLSSHFSVIALWRSCTINIWQCRALNVHIHCLSIVPICND